MSVSLMRQEATYRRTFVYAVSGKPDATRTGDRTLIPHAVKIELDRDSEHRSWGIFWITIYGSRRLKGGKVGASQADHHYPGTDDPEMPPWARDLARAVLTTAERNRLALADEKTHIVLEH